MRRGDSLVVEGPRDRWQRQAALPQLTDVAPDSVWNHGRTAEPRTVGAQNSERIARALSDQPSLELGKDRQHVRHHLPRWGRRIYAEVKRSHGPTLCPAAFHEICEVHQAS